MATPIARRTRREWQQLAAESHLEGRAFIDGRYVNSADGRTFSDVSPIDGSVLTAVARCDSADVDIAVAGARKAFEEGSWRRTEPAVRKGVLHRFAQLVRDDLEQLALLETLDVGKPISNSLEVDVVSAANCLAYYAEFADKLYDEIAPTGPSELALVRREPLGVVAAIVPWNYPLIISAWKLGPALLAGNSVVLKPAEQSPLSGIRLGELGARAGLPPGVFNVVPGLGEEAGQALARHGDVDMVSFTGSTEVGKLMMRYSSESNLKRVTLECGGKSPHVVMRDADIEAAAAGIAWGIYYNQGETCHAGSRVIVHASIKDELLAAITRVAATITLGHPLQPETQMGALIDGKHMQRVLDYIDSGTAQGARLMLGGKRALTSSGGYYVEATILDRVRPEMRVAREEIFGPVLAVTAFEEEAQAVRLANDSIFGLAARDRQIHGSEDHLDDFQMTPAETERQNSAHRIAAIRITHHRLRLDPPFNASWDSKPRAHFDATIVRVITDSGLVGCGSGDLMVGFEGHEPLFIGWDPLAVERHYRVLANLDFHYGRCWPLDLALWDLAGQITAQPCWRLLGGLRDRVRAYASSGTLREPAAMADAAERYRAAGFGALKLRFHRGDWRDDVKALEAVRARIGNRLELMVDCNQGWRQPWDTQAAWTLKDAMAVARELERLNVYWMEEPLHRRDRAGMRALRDATSVRIAAGEMTRQSHELRDLIDDRAVDVLQPDAALVGGITGLRRIAFMAQEHDLSFTPHTWTNGMGVIANTHLVAGLCDAEFIEFPFDPPQWSPDRRDFMLAAPLAADSNGWLILSDAPGMGYVLDEERLAATRIR